MGQNNTNKDDVTIIIVYKPQRGDLFLEFSIKSEQAPMGAAQNWQQIKVCPGEAKIRMSPNHRERDNPKYITF